MFKPGENSDNLLHSNIKKEVEKVFQSKDELDEDVVSVFSVINIYREVKENKKRNKARIEELITSKIQIINTEYSAIIEEPENNEVIVSIKNNVDIVEVKFQKKEDTLYVSKGDDIYLKLIGAEVDDWYDYCCAFEDEREQYSYGIKSINSDFLVDISETCSCVYYKPNQITSSFRLISFYDENDELYLKCKIKELKELIKGKEFKFVNNIFVNISDCPPWMQRHLYMDREEQLEDIRLSIQIEKDAKKQLTKKQKRRAFWKKIFPFIK